MIQLLLPMMVLPPPSTVPRLKVHSSRMVLSSPMISSVSCPAYFLSCGSSPMEANWKTAGHDHVRPDTAAGADRYLGTDDAERTDFHVVRQCGGRVDQCGFVNLCHVSIVPRR